MKENYIYYNGDVLIENNNTYNSTIEKRKYQDNIEKILETENIIEGISKEKENYNESLILKKKSIKLSKKSNATVITCSVFAGILITLLSPFNITPGMPLLTFLLSSSCTLGILSPIILSNLKNIKERNKEINGLNLGIEKANRLLIYNEQLLDELKLNTDKTNEFVARKMEKPKKVDYIKKLQEFKKILYLYCTIGINEEEFKEYYEKGWLDSKLERNFKESEIETIKTYFKTKKTK